MPLGPLVVSISLSLSSSSLVPLKRSQCPGRSLKRNSITFAIGKSDTLGKRQVCLSNRAVIKFHFGPLVDSLETSSMYFFCKILNSLEFGVMDKLLLGWKFLETGLNTYARPNISELKNLHRAGI